MNKHHITLAPLLREVLQTVKKATEMTEACGGMTFDTKERCYGAISLFNDEVMGEEEVWRALRTQYTDRELTKELKDLWTAHIPKWDRDPDA
jgi:hypothetical protein